MSSGNFIIYLAAAGLLAGFLFLLIFLYKRIGYVTRRLQRKESARPGFTFTSLRNLLLIFLWVAIFSMLFFAGFFFQAYHAFSLKQPVARIMIESKPNSQKALISLIQLDPLRESRKFTVRGEQWVLEGDILKWNDWLNFAGLHTRYRLTRLRGRYMQTQDEKIKPSSVYSLTEYEDHPVWGFLYKHGPRLPFVQMAYGNAVFQLSGEGDSFLVYVTTSGFMAKKEK